MSIAFSVYLTGYYIYAEASFPRQAGDRARLVSPRLIGPHCVQFSYHMYGNQMGTLRMFRLAGAQTIAVETHSGDSGKRWHSIMATMRLPQNYQVNFAMESIFDCFRVLTDPELHIYRPSAL